MKNKALIGVIAGVVAAAAIIAIVVAKNASNPDETIDVTPQATVEPVQGDATPVPETSGDENSEQQENNTENAAGEVNNEDKVYTPTFMYFVSKSDEGYDATMVMIEELKKEYADRVKFDIQNIDDDPSLVERFPVKDNTPTLFMLNTKNDISNILFKTKDKQKLADAIAQALQN